jgi:site-specific recombinase XerD
MDITRHFRSFIAFCRRQGHSQHTLRAYQSDLHDFQKWLHAQYFKELDRAVLENWLNEMRNRKYAPSTIKRKLATLKVAFNWIEENGCKTKNPFHGFKSKIKLPRKLPKALSRAELLALFSQAEQETRNGAGLRKKTMRLALEFLFATGIRVGELCGINLKDIDIDDGIIRIYGKGSRERLVYVIDDNILLLMRYHVKSHPFHSFGTDTLLLTRRGTAATPDYIRRNLHELARRAKIKRRVTPHMLRHRAATQLLEQGVDITLCAASSRPQQHINHRDLHSRLQCQPQSSIDECQPKGTFNSVITKNYHARRSM